MGNGASAFETFQHLTKEYAAKQAGGIPDEQIIQHLKRELQKKAEEEAKEKHELAIAAVLRMQKLRDQNKDKMDYSASFSGSAEDTKNEKEFGKLVTGDDESSSVNISEALDAFLCPMESGMQGTWKRIIANPTFFIHSVTNEVRYVRPEAFVEVEVKKRTPEDDKFAHIPKGRLCDLLEHVDEICRRKKTPLILDASPDSKVETFYSYKGMVIDVRGLAMGFMKTKVKTKDAIENVRKVLVSALKAGKTTVCIALGDQAPMFKSKLCAGENRDSFPIETFQSAGQPLLQRRMLEKLFRDADKEHGQCLARPGFRVVVVSCLPASKYEEALKKDTPLAYMEPIRIVE